MKYTDCPCHDCLNMNTPPDEPYDCGCDNFPVYDLEACSECPSRHKCDVPKHPELYSD